MFKTILFDVDGVLLSEERYFDASALTVWELIHSPNYLGLDSNVFTPSPNEDLIRNVRSEVFDRDRTLNFIKGRGINANWDMVYLTFAYQLVRLLSSLYETEPDEVEAVLQGPLNRETLQRLGKKANERSLKIDYASFVSAFEKSDAQKQALLLYLNTILYENTRLETSIFTRNSELWDVCQEAFQEWYLGENLVEASIGKPPLQKGKNGFLDDEIPIVKPERMAEVFQELRDQGIILGIGTGRPRIETVEPLKAMGLLDYFEENQVVSATEVLETERAYPDASPLAKPQPYCYVQGLLGLDADPKEAIDYTLPIENGDEVLIVGDSLADYLAAQTIGCRFAATLTGLSGKEARTKFEELNADYIWDDMTEITRII